MYKTQAQLRKKLNKNLLEIKNSCERINKKHLNFEEMSHKEYIYFVFSYNIYLRTKDLLILYKKLLEEKNSFDSSLLVLSRVINEEFFYMSYLLSEPQKIKYRLEALTCHNCELNISKFNIQLELNRQGKFILKNIDIKRKERKIKEWQSYIDEHKEHKNNDPKFTKEINDFKNVEEICKKYDKIKSIKIPEVGKENESLEWTYNNIYRFQSLSVHQSLNDKEKIFNLILNQRNKPNNSYILLQINDILDRILNFKKFILEK